MKRIEEQILEQYSIDYSIEALSYELMGKMLDSNYVEERLRMFDINHMYIYGGTYMAIQLYRSGERYVTIHGIVDKYGKSIGKDKIPVIMLDEFREKYNGEKVIITPLRYFFEIQNDLEKFVDKENILGIGELLLGIR